MQTLQEIISITREEGDEKLFRYRNRTCVILRHPDMGHLCGYLSMTPQEVKQYNHYDDYPIDVHGGWTYMDGLEHRNPDLVGKWVGFDCAHFGDLAPYMEARTQQLMHGLKPEHVIVDADVYRNMEYVEQELRHAVEQLQGAATT